MLRSFLLHSFLTFLLGTCPLLTETLPAWQTGGISSQHVYMAMPAERESLGRELIGDIEHCYGFMNRATDGSLPRKIFVTADWDQPYSACDRRGGSILVGMSQPTGDLKQFFFLNVAREMARMGLLELSDGAQREDTEFLFEGMIEILVNDYNRTSRRLEAAWIFSKYLDEMQMLGLATQRSWSKFSGGEHCFRNASPGITFLTTFRLLQGREQLIKLFKALRKNSLADSLTEAFKAPVAELESTWLKKVREYSVTDEITTVPEEAPQLRQTSFVPYAGRPGAGLELRLIIVDSAQDLLPSGVFVRDGRTGRLFQVHPASENGAQFLAAEIPIDINCPPGRYKYQVTAIDEDGNVRSWNGDYSVVSSQ